MDPQMIRVFPIKKRDWNVQRRRQVFSIHHLITAIHELRGEAVGKEV